MKNCQYAHYTEDDNLMYCQHKENKEDSEGNCGVNICPLGVLTYELLEDNYKVNKALIELGVKMQNFNNEISKIVKGFK